MTRDIGNANCDKKRPEEERNIYIYIYISMHVWLTLIHHIYLIVAQRDTRFQNKDSAEEKCDDLFAWKFRSMSRLYCYQPSTSCLNDSRLSVPTER